jgi:RHS repeat-associated protein
MALRHTSNQIHLFISRCQFAAVRGAQYNPIGTFTTASKFEASTAGSDLLAARSDLWNGNISHMVTCLPKASDYATNQTITPEAFGSAYKYDQLNRLSSSRVFTNINNTTNQWQSGAGTNPSAYATDYTYDPMGNILTQKRNGGGASPTALDELTYNYHSTTDGLVSNRLYHVNDVVSAGNYSDDIDDQGTFNNTHSTIETANNYGYDELGNLVRDAQEEIASIEWTVYGKMKKITRNSGSSKADLEFGYDASGNRLWKKVTPKGSGAVISTYYYLRDAQGNEMCRYVKYTNTNSQLMYVAEEHSIYGSSRVGVDNRKDTLYMGAVYTPTWGGVGTSRRALGLKSFELANHLGNVLVTVSDKPIYKVSSTTIFFNPEITSTSDYYPFGAPIQGQSAAFGGEYRFGFNTQEKTDEISGPGNHNTATFWEYDTRLGRRWRPDPLQSKYPHTSPYAAFGNNPILFIDVDGKEIKVHREKDEDGSTVIVVTFTGKLVNNSSTEYTQEQLQGIADRMVTGFVEAYTGEGENVKWRGIANITVASDDNPLTETDHAIRLYDNGKLPDDKRPGKTKPEFVVGLAPAGERVIEINTYITETDYVNRTFPHEVGHSGYMHKENGVFVGHPQDINSRPGNLMHQTLNPNSGMKLDEDQILQLEKDYNAVKLNKGRQEIK